MAGGLRAEASATVQALITKALTGVAAVPGGGIASSELPLQVPFEGVLRTLSVMHARLFESGSFVGSSSSRSGRSDRAPPAFFRFPGACP